MQLVHIYIKINLSTGVGGVGFGLGEWGGAITDPDDFDPMMSHPVGHVGQRHLVRHFG